MHTSCGEACARTLDKDEIFHAAFKPLLYQSVQGATERRTF